MEDDRTTGWQNHYELSVDLRIIQFVGETEDKLPSALPPSDLKIGSSGMLADLAHAALEVEQDLFAANVVSVAGVGHHNGRRGLGNRPFDTLEFFGASLGVGRSNCRQRAYEFRLRVLWDPLAHQTVRPSLHPSCLVPTR